MAKTFERLPDELLESYRLVRRLPHSGAACVYEVIATRGRLRNRPLAVKKVPADRKRETPAALHQSLSHPGIVALHSVVPSLGPEYHILELCAAGNLTDFLDSRNPPILSDKEVQRLVKDIAAALAYLKQEGVIHRNICGSNTLIAKGFQAKLCDFEHSIQKEAIEPTAKFAHATYPAPETLRAPYHFSFAMDMWAFGCLVISCLQESLPTTNSLPLDPECLRVLSGYSRNFQDLIVSLVAMDPLERLRADDIMQHPGLHESFTRDDPSSSKTSSRLACYSSYGFSEWCPVTSSSLRSSSTAHDQRAPNDDLRNVTNTKLRDYILKQSKSTKPPKLTMRPISPSLGSPNIPSSKVDQDKDQRTVSKEGTISTPRQPKTIPMGTTRPIAFDTNLLSVATHKLAGGSITVLPSLSVLVDFRENQRRNGFKGNYVLLIDSTGGKINIYSAPHLSVPSCLLEPMETFAVDDLPPVYWKQYNDASSSINAIKRKTPQMTVHKSGARCVLMSNLPQPDIEVVVNSSYPSNTDKMKTDRSGPIMRIRYSRQNCSLELSEHKGPEWKKECTPCHDLDRFMATNNSRLSDTCREGFRLLVEFLKTCDGLTRPETQHISSPSDSPTPLRPDSPLDVPMSLSSIRIPDKPLKYPRKASTASNKENLHPSSSTRHPASEDRLPKRSPVAAEGTLPDTRYLPGIGWCIRKLVIPASPKMKYQLMFNDGICLEVNFYSGVLTFTPVQGTLVRCLISAKSSYPDIEKRLNYLKDFMLLYDQADTTIGPYNKPMFSPIVDTVRLLVYIRK